MSRLLDDLREHAFLTIYTEDYSGASWIECRECCAVDGMHGAGCLTGRMLLAVEALEYYADRSNYLDQDNSCTDECCDGPWPSIPVLDQDGGATARAALGIEDE